MEIQLNALLIIIIIIIIIIGIQPLGRSGQRPELSQVTGMALVRCILGKFLGVACHCFPPLFRCSHFSPPGASEGRRAEDFFALKNPTASAGFEPANLGTKGQHATPRPPKPLCNVNTGINSRWVVSYTLRPSCPKEKPLLLIK